MYQTADVPQQYLNKELDDWNVNADSLGNDLDLFVSQMYWALLLPKLFIGLPV
jgi:hypothetical protein